MYKRLFLIAVITICISDCIAQYYNPYTSAQERAAYEWGRQLGEQQKRQQQEFYKSLNETPNNLSYNATEDLINGRLPDAIEKYEKAIDKGNYTCAFNLGIIYELGLGVQVNHSRAKAWYRLGAANNDNNSRIAYNRIKNGDYIPATNENKAGYINYMRNIMGLSSKMANDIVNSFNWESGNTPSNVSKSSKVCSRCAGRKYDPMPYKHSASSDSYHWSGGRGCSFCNTINEHYHYRCHYCNANGFER
jgi:sel1 family repeat-containing serine/threonine protein kinase